MQGNLKILWEKHVCNPGDPHKFMKNNSFDKIMHSVNIISVNKSYTST